MNKNFSKLLVAALFMAGFSASGLVSAAGFALIEQSASGMGNAFAGAAATAEDASTIFFNPAGLTRLSGKQVLVAGHYIAPSFKFSNNGSSASPTAIGTLGGNGGDGGTDALVPNIYVSIPVGEQLVVGVGVNVPFGLATEYDASWVGRFQGVKSDIKTLNINPSVAYKFNDTISVGAGINYQKIDAELTNKVSGAPLGFAGSEFSSSLTADDTAWGYNLGVLIQATADTRIGVSYRSKMDYTLEGQVDVRSPSGAAVGAVSGPSKADITLPDTISISLVQRLSDKTDLLFDVTQTRWSEIQNIKILNSFTGATRETLVLNFDDSYRYSVGVNHKCTDRFTARLGVALDRSPVNDANRTVRIPDNDRTWIAIGGQWKVGEHGMVDLGFAHLFIKDAGINQTRGNPLGYGTVAGDYTGSINILSLQYGATF